MKEILYKYLLIGDKFVLNDIEYIKTNHNRAFEWVKINNRKEKRFINIRKNKIVLSNVKAFDVENN